MVLPKGQGVHEELGADLDLRRAAARIRTREAYGAHAPSPQSNLYFPLIRPSFASFA